MSEHHGTVLVLGASGVLGAGLTRAFAAGGFTVIGTASSTASLERIPSAAEHRFATDLRSPASCDQLVASVVSLGVPLTGIVVASGVVGFATIEATPAHLAADMMRINHSGPAAVIAGLFDSLREAPAGTAFVAGITGVVVEQSFPGMSAYTASKAAHSAFLQSTAKEWRRHKIAVVDLRLGHTETGLATRALFGQAPAMPAGHDAQHAVAVIVASITERASIVPSTAF